MLYYSVPGVKREMLSPHFWLERMENRDDVILNRNEIEKLNKRTARRMKDLGLESKYCDLKEFPDHLNKKELEEMLVETGIQQFPLDRAVFNSEGQIITEKQKKGIIKEENLEEVGKRAINYGVLTGRADVRAFPTDIVFAEEKSYYDHDIFQLSTLPAGTPVAIIHRSFSGDWVYVQAKLYRGWIEASKIAIAHQKEDIFLYTEARDFLIVTGNRLETEPNPFMSNISGVGFQLGDRIPLVPEGEIPLSLPEGNLHGQSPDGCYVVWVPVANDRGYLNYKKALIAGSNEVNCGYLPYTRGNLVRGAFTMFGERYGWGGDFNRSDCSRLIMDVYRTVGIEIPRDTGKPQEKGPEGEELVFSGGIKERLEVMEKLEPGDPVYLPGHVVLYLGKVNNEHYVIHDGAGYGRKDEDGNLVPVTVHSVFIMNVSQQLMHSKKSYLERFTVARKLR